MKNGVHGRGLRNDAHCNFSARFFFGHPVQDKAKVNAFELEMKPISRRSIETKFWHWRHWTGKSTLHLGEHEHDTGKASRNRIS